MSSQKGNAQRNRPQKHKNTKAFRNDLYDTSHTTKKINSLEFYGLCSRCKDKIDWRVKFKKYKPLTVPKKCVKCLEKKVKMAYYIVCQDCCQTHKICSKCSKDCEELEFGESEVDRRRKEDEFQAELKSLSERQRRKFLRLLEKGLLTKENLMTDGDQFRKDDGSDDDFDSDDFDEDEDFDEESDSNEPKKPSKKAEAKKQKQESGDDSELDDEEDDDEDGEDDDEEEYDEDDDEEGEWEDEEEDEEDEEPETIAKESANKAKSKVSFKK